MMKLKLLVLFICLVLVPAVMAQDATVPDLTGMNIPAAAAALNKVGLKLGTQTAEGWTEASGLPQNTISTQSIEAGSAAEPGATVDVTVLRSANVRLQYDDNDLTFINLRNAQLGLDGLSFNAVDGNRASFTRWSGMLRPNQCLQVWSISRNGPKGLPECDTVQNWVVTTNRAEHFWTTSSGATSFEVLVDGIVRGTCDAAPPNTQDNPLTCEFYIPAAGASENAPFVYLMYNSERLIVKNPTTDKWLRTNQTVYNQNPNRSALGDSFVLGNREKFNSPDIVANVRQLAPGQCLLFKAAGVENEPLPEDCDVVATLELPASELFWLFNFEFETGNSNKRYSCPAAVADKRTLCIMPRS